MLLLHIYCDYFKTRFEKVLSDPFVPTGVNVIAILRYLRIAIAGLVPQEIVNNYLLVRWASVHGLSTESHCMSSSPTAAFALAQLKISGSDS
jgi:hypothetical protein